MLERKKKKGNMKTNMKCGISRNADDLLAISLRDFHAARYREKASKGKRRRKDEHVISANRSPSSEWNLEPKTIHP